MIKPTRNISDLRNDLDTVFTQLKTNKIKPEVASQMCNAASKIMTSVKIELSGYAAAKMRPNIPYLNLTDLK